MKDSRAFWMINERGIIRFLGYLIRSLINFRADPQIHAVLILNLLVLL